MSIFEMGMLVCFGVAWPASIYRSYRSRTNSGKSLSFLLIVLLGYVMGVLHKWFYNRDGVIFFYLFNMTLIFIDLGLYYRNYRIQKKKG